MIIRAEDDLLDAKDLYSLIEDLQTLRNLKIQKIAEQYSFADVSVSLKNICAKELEGIRPFFNEVMKKKVVFNLQIKNNEEKL